MQQNMVQKDTMASKADGRCLHTYESICLSRKLKSVPFYADFLVCWIADDTILEMELLSHCWLFGSLWQRIPGHSGQNTLAH